jgi:hypothetical protein
VKESKWASTRAPPGKSTTISMKGLLTRKIVNTGLMQRREKGYVAEK